MVDVKGVILCGGPGTRLRPITYYFQKSMIPVGKKQKPLLEYIVRLLKFYDIENLIFLVDYKAEQIINYFDSGSRFGVKIEYVFDDPSLKGTAGSIVNAYRKNVLSTKDTLLVYYGDILTNMNLQDFLMFHREKNAVVTIALSKGFSVRVGVAELDKNGRIQGFQEKPRIEKPVSIAITVIEGEVLEEMDNLANSNPKLDLMGDVIPHLISDGKNVYGYVTEAFWYDIGSTEAYEKLDHEIIDEIFDFLYKG